MGKDPKAARIIHKRNNLSYAFGRYDLAPVSTVLLRLNDRLKLVLQLNLLLLAVPNRLCNAAPTGALLRGKQMQGHQHARSEGAHCER